VWSWNQIVSKEPEPAIVSPTVVPGVVNQSLSLGYQPTQPSNVTPRNKVLVITVGTGAAFGEILLHNRTIQAYADRIGADYVELKDTTQVWWGYEKFRVYDYALDYDYTIYLDADCIVADNCPNLINLLGTADVLLHDDWLHLHSQQWLVEEKSAVYESQGLPVDTEVPATCYNTGVVVCRQSSAGIWKPPILPLPRKHCDEQSWIEYQCFQYKVNILPREYNNQWWMKDFEEYPCYIKHYSSDPQRLEVFRNMNPLPPCQFLEADTGECNIISELAREPYYPTPEECQGCGRCTPSQSVNDVTRTIANQLLIASNKPPLLETVGGPGTTLKKTLSWFHTSSSCGCEERAAIMDAWGVQGCEENIRTILFWLRDSAASQGLPYSEAAMTVILKSIFITEKIKCVLKPATA
jgi:hypothetical protein